MKTGRLPRLDREGVPKFPLFMYDEDVIEPGKVTNGLFRGPLLVAASSFSFGLHSLRLTVPTGLPFYFRLKAPCRGGGKDSSKGYR